MADSRAQEYLVPLGLPPLDDDPLLDVLQPIIVGIGGYADASFVRPRWQPDDTPNQPQFEQDWAAVGIARTRPETFQSEMHVADGDGYNVFEYSEEVDVMISCYGPRAQGYARRLRDGFRVAQNRVPLQANDMDTLYCGDPVTLPSLLHGRWLRRVDVTITLRRRLETRYGVLNVLSAGNGIDNEHYVTPIVVEAPPSV